MISIGINSSGGFGQLFNQYERTNSLISQSLERLSTGKRINRASDDPAGLIAATGLQGDLVELRAQSRVADAERQQLHRRESALSGIQRILTEVRGSLVAAADGFNSDSQNKAIQQEINASLDAIDRIANDATGVSDSAPLVELREGGTANVVDGDIGAATELIEKKLASLGSARAAIGAYERAHVDTFERIREDQTVIAAQTLSQIEDADFAAESSNFVKGKILSEAAIAALAFSNREQAQQMKTLLEGLESK